MAPQLQRPAGTGPLGQLGRPRLDRDFVAIRDALNERRDEPGVVARVAREFDVSRAWLYKWIIPTHDGLSGTPAGNEEESESTRIPPVDAHDTPRYLNHAPAWMVETLVIHDQDADRVTLGHGFPPVLFRS